MRLTKAGVLVLVVWGSPILGLILFWAAVQLGGETNERLMGLVVLLGGIGVWGIPMAGMAGVYDAPLVRPKETPTEIQ